MTAAQHPPSQPSPELLARLARAGILHALDVMAQRSYVHPYPEVPEPDSPTHGDDSPATVAAGSSTHAA